MASVINYGGMGVTKPVTAKDVMTLPSIDVSTIIKPIKNKIEAIKLLKSFY